MTENESFPVRGIIFDLDGTLYHMKWFMKPLLTILVAPHSLRLPGYMAVRKRFMGKDMSSGEALMEAMAESLAQRSKCTPQAARTWIFDRFYTSFVRIMPFLRGSRPGATETLRKLRKKGIKLSVLSDFACIHERMAGIRLSTELFDTISSSETMGGLKPSPRPLLDIASDWGLGAESILVIGDRTDTDGVAAAKAGMQFMRIGDKKGGGRNSWHKIQAYLESLPSV